MKYVRRDPNKGYLCTFLWVPKTFVNVEGIRQGLTFQFSTGRGNTTKVLSLYQETQHHMLVPRAFYEVGSLPFEVVSCLPEQYETVEFQSRIKLDHRLQEIDGVRGIFPTGRDVQQKSLAALEGSMGGILQLSCGIGKAQPVDTPIPTPDGWRQMGDLHVGDHVIGSDGLATAVTEVHPQGSLPVYLITMEDGTSTRCCGNHLWFTQTPRDRSKGKPGAVRTTNEIKETLRNRAGAQHSVQRSPAIHFNPRPAVYAPWVFGAYLGDGSSAIYGGSRRLQFDKGSLELHSRLATAISATGDVPRLLPPEKRNNNRTTRVLFRRGETGVLWGKLTELGLVGVPSEEKFIPEEYMFASVQERWELLNGLLDTDGSITPTGRSFSTSSPCMAKDVAQLARSLGCRVSTEPRQTRYTYKGVTLDGAPSWRLYLTHARWGAGRYTKQYIQSIEPAGTALCVCIRVQATNSLYITENFIVTHNTVIALEHLARAREPALILVDNTQLLSQWQGEIQSLLTVPGGVGLIGDGERDWKRGLVLGTYQSVSGWADTMPEEVRRWFGNIYWDEGHHVSAPVFAKTAALFYGRRYLLTATPERADGLHVIGDYHIGKVLYRDLSQPLTTRILFYWTQLALDLANPTVADATLDRNKEIHIAKVFSYFGRWRARLELIIRHAKMAVAAGRRVLFVGSGVDEVVNLMALWTWGDAAPLYSDIPFPTASEAGVRGTPLEMSKRELSAAKTTLERSCERASNMKFSEDVRRGFELRCKEIEDRLRDHDAFLACSKQYRRLQRAYIKELCAAKSTSGLLTEAVPLEDRVRFVRERQVIFAIMKYGKEGMDAPTLDTILVSSPFSQEGALRQLIGRITGRPSPGKKSCVVVIYRDNIGEMHGMCKKLERHVRAWPAGQGGPDDVEHINHMPAGTPRALRIEQVLKE